MEIKRYTLKGVNWALAGLLAMLGISCSGENGMNGHEKDGRKLEFRLYCIRPLGRIYDERSRHHAADKLLHNDSMSFFLL